MLRITTLCKIAAVALDFGELEPCRARVGTLMRTRSIESLCESCWRRGDRPCRGLQQRLGRTTGPARRPPAPAAAPAVAERRRRAFPSAPTDRRSRSQSAKVEKPSPRSIRPSIRSTCLRSCRESRSGKWSRRRESRSRPTPSPASCPPRGSIRRILNRSNRPNRVRRSLRNAARRPGDKRPSRRHPLTNRPTARQQSISGEAQVVGSQGGPDRRAGDQRTGDRKTAGRKLAERKTDEAEPAEPASLRRGQDACRRDSRPSTRAQRIAAGLAVAHPLATATGRKWRSSRAARSSSATTAARPSRVRNSPSCSTRFTWT